MTLHSKADAPTDFGSPEGGEKSVERKKRRNLKPLRVLTPYLARYRGVVIAALIALVSSSLATLAVPLGARRMIDLGFSADNAAFINKYFLMMIAVGAVLAVSAAARYYFVNWLGERLVADLRDDVFSHLTRLSPAFYDQTHSAEVMSRLTADTTQIKAAIGTSASQALRNVIMVIGSILMMIITSPWLSLLVILAIPLIILPLFAYGRTVRRLSRDAQDTLAESSAYAAENLSSIRTLQAYTNEHNVQSRFHEGVERTFDAARIRMKARAGLTVIAIFLVFASIICILWYGASEVLAGTMSGGTLGQFVLYAALAAGSLGGLSEIWGEVQQTAGAAERLAELLKVETAIKSPVRPIDLPATVRGELGFKDVSFTYPSRPDSAALDSLSFHIKPGETIAIVGPSGSGKSTIFNLLLRFYDPDTGVITLDGVDISKLSLGALRRQIALVPQEMALFADTIAENIRYGTSGASREDIKNAARAAHADEFISLLPDGFDTKLGEKGATLSGGQRQRIVIARAVLRNAPILLLDEATSALDAQSEKLVQEALEELKKGRTTLIIAHRLATVQAADRIFVLDGGRLVETGTHKSLMNDAGIYARLADLQFNARAAE